MEKRYVYSNPILFVLFSLLFSFQVMGQSVIYDGTLYDSAGDVIAEPGVKMKAEILNNDSSCVMYEREFTLDLSTTSGHFTLDMSSGTAPTAEPHTANTLVDILSSANGNTVTCSNNLNYGFTGVFEERVIRLTVTEVNSVDVADIQLPAQTLRVLPYAQESGSSLSIQGVKVDAAAPNHGQVLRYNTANLRYEPSDVIATSIDWPSIVGIPSGIADGDDDTTYSVATGAVDGLMSAADKSKLDALEASATGDQTPAEILTAISTVDGASSGLDSDLLDGQSGAHYLAWGNLTGVPAGFADGVDADTTYAQVTGAVDGLMIAADKTKLDGVEANATGDQSAGEILTAISTVDGASSGLDADLLDGANASTAAGNNTIVQRDASGYVYANYFNTTAAATATAPSAVLVETGSDGFMRKQTLAQLIANIASDGISGDKIDGGTISTFRSTGVDDNADALAMTINSSENVGIGTPSPSGRLDVEGGDVFIGTATMTNLSGSEDLSVTGNVEVDGSVYAASYLYLSDARFKTESDEKVGLEQLLKMRGLKFYWKKDGSLDVGLIAQEVEKVFPELVHTNPKTGHKSVKYGNLVAPLIEAVKQLNSRIESERQQRQQMQEENKQLRKQLSELSRDVEKIKASLSK